MQPICPRAAATLAGLALLTLESTPAAPTPGHAAPVQAATTAVVVNEFAPSGQLWSTDEFVELRNTGDQWLALDGLELVACLSPSTTQVATWFGPADEIPPGGYFLLAHPDFADAFGGPAPDRHYHMDVPDDGGWVLYDPWNGYVDGVGLASGLDCTEGDPAPQCDWEAGEAAAREGGDTDDNSTDFTCQSRTGDG